MTVLMFGWEFPPHISGGLGTACQGLTKALAEEKINVLFVVPKLYGEEKQQGVELLNASNVPVTFSGWKTSIEKKTLSPFATAIVDTAVVDKETDVTVKTPLTTIHIASSLIPYQPAQQERMTQNIAQWNYPYADHPQIRHPQLASASGEEQSVADDRVTTTYSFKGGYGADLMEEVSRYAQVAAALPDHHSFDVIHAHDWMTFAAGIEVKKRTGKPLVVHVHATEHDRASRINTAVYQIEKEGMEKADRVVAVSGWTKNIIIERYKIPPEKIDVVHNGIEQQAFIPPPSSFIPPGSHTITFLGRITHQKGPHYFVEAARKVIEHFPDAHFIMAGSGDLFPQIIERVAQLKLSAHFHFTGFLKKKEIDQLLSLTQVYVMPSVSEPFGITPLEAIRAGVPVIISNQSGVVEVMPHALKVDFWNSTALANAISSVLKYESLSDTLIRNSVQHMKGITWNRAAKKLKTIYHELLNSNN